MVTNDRVLVKVNLKVVLELPDTSQATDIRSILKRRGGQMRLLIVDDDPDQIHWLEKSFLSVDGYDVYSAYNADEAWEVYQAAQPDVVITDYQCGGKKLMDGIPQLRKPFLLRSLQRILRLPVQPLLF